MKNKSALTIIRVGGAINVLMTLFHVYLCFVIHRNYQHAAVYPLLQMFAISGTIMIGFLAITSLAHAETLAASSLGLAVLGLNLAIYLGRAVGELLLFPQPKPLIIALCLLITGVYALAAAKRHAANKARDN